MQQPIKNNKPHQKGYILIELAIVMVALSLLATVMIPIYQTYQQRNAVSETEQRMEVISKALSSYAQTRFRLPCPAAPSVPAGEQLGVEIGSDIDGDGIVDQFGVCNAATADAHGIVPYRTLGIPEQYAKDGYGNFFTYVVSPNFTVDNRLGLQLDQVNIRLSHLVGEKRDFVTANPIPNTDKFALLPRAQFCAPLVRDTPSTDITVIQDGKTLFAGAVRDTTNIARDRNPDANLNRDTAVTTVALAIISHGENGKGAYQVDGSQLPSLPAGTSEEITSRNSNGIVQVEAEVSDTGANEYDDIVAFYTQDEIYAAAGRNSCEHL